MKDGNKNRLRSQDIHRIVETFNHLREVPGYSRMAPLSEIRDSRRLYKTRGIPTQFIQTRLPTKVFMDTARMQIIPLNR